MVLAISGGSGFLTVTCNGTCEHPGDVDDCASCCPGSATCCVCCANWWPSGRNNQYCKAYCQDIHGSNCDG